MWQTTALHFAADHPVTAGHFPGDPIIPGALLLDHVLAAIGGGGGLSVRAAKFMSMVRPGAALNLRWRVLEGGAVTFECILPDEILAMTGTFEINGRR